jgi:hypothetical protein
VVGRIRKETLSAKGQGSFSRAKSQGYLTLEKACFNQVQVAEEETTPGLENSVSYF